MTVRTFALAALFAAGAITAAATVAVAQLESSPLAPANEYFGRLRLSIAGIRNSITILRSQASDEAFSSESVRARIALLEDAVSDWEHKYPRDPAVGRYRAELSSLTTHLSMAR